MINLREASSPTVHATEFQSSISFARFGISASRIGNIGDPLRFGDEGPPTVGREDGIEQGSTHLEKYTYSNFDSGA